MTRLSLRVTIVAFYSNQDNSFIRPKWPISNRSTISCRHLFTSKKKRKSSQENFNGFPLKTPNCVSKLNKLETPQYLLFPFSFLLFSFQFIFRQFFLRGCFYYFSSCIFFWHSKAQKLFQCGILCETLEQT